MKLVHLGRNLWAKLLEMLEEESIGIQMMGNWNPLMQSSCYSLRLQDRVRVVGAHFVTIRLALNSTF
jgi:hypothetical protein